MQDSGTRVEDRTYQDGIKRTKAHILTLIDGKIDAVRSFRNEMTEAGNQVGIDNANSGLLSFQTIKIMIMEQG